MNDLNLNEIIADIGKYDGYFPKEAVKKAIQAGEELEPHLLNLIEHILKSVTADLSKEVSNENWQSFIIAVYLLSKLRSKSAYKHFINICKLPEDMLYTLLNDSVTESLHQFLGSTFDGNLDILRELIIDENIEIYARSSILKTYLVLYKNDLITREKIISEFKILFSLLSTNDSELISYLVCYCDDIYAIELKDEIYSSFNNKLVDNSVIELSEIEKTFHKANEKIMYKFMSNDRFNLVDNPIKEMEWWFCWKKDPVSNTPIKTKTGRNDLCSCGSGKKYKKCCLYSNAHLLSAKT